MVEARGEAYLRQIRRFEILKFFSKKFDLTDFIVSKTFMLRKM